MTGATRPVSFVAGERERGERLDAAIARVAGVSRTVAARAVDEGRATVNGRRVPRSARLEPGMTVSVALHEAAVPAEPQPEEVDIPIVYEDDDVLVVSKPPGLVVHPAPGHPAGTLVNALLARAGRPAGGSPERPGIVHRLDAGTSGLLIVAKSEAIHARLVRMMSDRAVSRTYLALVDGSPATETATIDAPIGRSPKQRKMMAVVAGGKPAVSRFTVLERFSECSLLEVRPETGRTHQIRVHLSAAGHPVCGDRVYGADRRLALALGLARPFLHAARLSFAHPRSASPVDLEDPLPPDLRDALGRASGSSPEN